MFLDARGVESSWSRGVGTRENSGTALVDWTGLGGLDGLCEPSCLSRPRQSAGVVGCCAALSPVVFCLLAHKWATFGGESLAPPHLYAA